MPTRNFRKTVKRDQRNVQDITGWMAIDKPKGITSAQVVNRLKSLFSARKVGHAGTLDKPAEGLLAVAFGEATKTIPFVMDSRKTYQFCVKFGESMSTDDASGEITATSQKRPTDAEIAKVIKQFTGDIMQVPPLYSAIKIEGKRAAAYAAAGKPKVLAARPLTVYRFDFVVRQSADIAEFVLECGKGGYVRSIARDVGQLLGCYGHVLSLKRTATGPFLLQDCVEFPEEDSEVDVAALRNRLLPLQSGLKDVPQVVCNSIGLNSLRNGNPVLASITADDNTLAWASYDGQAVAIGTITAGLFHPKRILKTIPFAHHRRDKLTPQNGRV